MPPTSPPSEPEKLLALPVSVPANAGAVTVPVKVGDARGAFKATLPLILLIALRMESVAVTVPAPDTNPVSAFPVTVVAATSVLLWVPVTSPASDPVKLPAVAAVVADVAEVAVLALPLRLAVIVPAEKFPLLSLCAMALGVLVLVAALAASSAA